MAHRLTRICTRTGDDGTTGLVGGRRVAKCALRIEAIGTVDEANSAIGVVLSFADEIPKNVGTRLTRVQHELFEVGAELCSPGHRVIGPGHVERLEADLDALNATLPPLEEFILPGGSQPAAACHLARAVCRRAERCVWALADRGEGPNAELAQYLNRLSDLLFVAARHLGRQRGGAEVLWERD